MISLDDMALFVAVVNAKGFTQAADKLAIPKSTISVRIKKLEQALGLQLLNRTTRKIELTAEGEFYFECAQRLTTEADQTHQTLQTMLNEPAGVLRIALPIEFAQMFVAPLVPEFRQRYPQIQLEMQLGYQRVDLISEPFDLAIRIGQLPDSNLIARRVGLVASHLFAAPSYVAQFGEPQTPEQLSSHQWLHFQAGFAEQWWLRCGKQETVVQIKGDILTNSLGMNLALAKAGLGITLLPRQTGLAQGNQLQQILPKWQSVPVPIYMVTTTRLLPAKTQCFINFLTEKMQDWLDS